MSNTGPKFNTDELGVGLGPSGWRPQLIGTARDKSGALPQASEPGSVPVWNGSMWVAKSPSAPKRPVILRPFVLRCPCCMAPTESGSTSCEYCQVPLVWEPIESLGRDDRGYRGLLDEDDDSKSVVAFSKVIVCMHSETVFTVHPRLVLRPTHLYVPPEFSKDFAITDFRIGTRSQLDSENPIPATLFSMGHGMALDCDTITPGLIVALKVENHAHRNQEFQAVMRCRRLT